MLGLVVKMARTNIMGCDFDSWDTQQALDHIEAMIQRDERGYLCTVNVSILMMMRDDQRLAEIIHRSKMVVADGQPVIWVSKYMKTPLPGRVTGVELVTLLAEQAQRNDWGIYLLGASKMVVEKVRDRLLTKYPKLIVSGCDDGYFDAISVDKQVNKIRASNAKILIVAMGVPRQEYFIDERWKDLGVNFAIGVGGSFDVIAGVSRRAPLWMQKTGLEWLFRLLQEPRRLFGRYVRTNSLFIYLFFKEVVLGMTPKKDNQS